MMNFESVLASILKFIAETAADAAYGSASILGMCQPKEPKRPSSLNN